MMNKLKLELNIALISDMELAEKQIALSGKLAGRHCALVRLGEANARLAMAPHLTLYQVPLFLADVAEADRRLNDTASGIGPFLLQATGYAYNEGEASFEISYESTSQLISLQAAVIDGLNPLRWRLLLERDPAGNDVQELFDTAKGVLGDNIQRTGYAEVGDPAKAGLFRPHATTNWFELGTHINLDTEPLPLLSSLSGNFRSLGMYVLGPHGTCPQLLAEYELTSKVY